jgi:tetratricopeptide (TPR) repeat protein
VDTAIAIYKELVASDRTSVPLLVSLGVAYYQRGDFPSAANILASALKIEPEIPGGLAFLGLSEAARGNSDAAIPPLSAAFRSTDAAVGGELKRLVGIQLAKAYSRQGRQEEAESVCQTLL